MTDHTAAASAPPRGSRALALALRLYPAAYRADRGPEITAVHADLTAHASPLATARETAGLAAYGLRLRTGTTSAHAAGRLLAAAAPLAVAAALGHYLSVTEYVYRPGTGHQNWDTAASVSPLGSVVLKAFYLALYLTVLGLWGAVAVTSVRGNWRLARLLAVPAALGMVIQAFVFTRLAFSHAGVFGAPDVLVQSAGPAVLWTVLLLAAPGDLLARIGWREPRRLAAPLTVLAVSAIEPHLHLDFALAYHGPVYGTAAVAVGLLLLLGLRWDRTLPAAIGLAVLPISLQMGTLVLIPRLGIYSGITMAALFMASAALATLLAAGAVRFLSRPRHLPAT
ncbi:hypothetical protein [Kitasatospora purpeofusca]|uniref:hypothetical protein n=1 Tax=Kitasatospora purpeofusca TaxID=67352 RepID=UPI002A5AB3A0|nr:hypothetical protein [Kitasatospora purpeofusca]MDY0809985.1 hypothetical protein [Kitasatospora purpeofusca]